MKTGRIAVSYSLCAAVDTHPNAIRVMSTAGLMPIRYMRSAALAIQPKTGLSTLLQSHRPVAATSRNDATIGVIATVSRMRTALLMNPKTLCTILRNQANLLYATTIPATSDAMAMTTRTIGFSDMTAFRMPCATAHALVTAVTVAVIAACAFSATVRPITIVASDASQGDSVEITLPMLCSVPLALLMAWPTAVIGGMSCAAALISFCWTVRINTCSS